MSRFTAQFYEIPAGKIRTMGAMLIDAIKDQPEDQPVILMSEILADGKIMVYSKPLGICINDKEWRQRQPSQPLKNSDGTFPSHDYVELSEVTGMVRCSRCHDAYMKPNGRPEPGPCLPQSELAQKRGAPATVHLNTDLEAPPLRCAACAAAVNQVFCVQTELGKLAVCLRCRGSKHWFCPACGAGPIKAGLIHAFCKETAAGDKQLSEESPAPAVKAGDTNAPEAVHGLRPQVWAFAWAMERALRTHDHDRGVRGWKPDIPKHLLNRLHQETAELANVLHLWERDPVTVIKECADVGNFAMMIADVTGALGDGPARSEGDEPPAGTPEAAHLLNMKIKAAEIVMNDSPTIPTVDTAAYKRAYVRVDGKDRNLGEIPYNPEDPTLPMGLPDPEDREQERRDELARIVHLVAQDRLPNPRDLDVALDAIECLFRSYGPEPVEIVDDENTLAALDYLSRTVAGMGFAVAKATGKMEKRNRGLERRVQTRNATIDAQAKQLAIFHKFVRDLTTRGFTSLPLPEAINQLRLELNANPIPVNRDGTPGKRA